VKRITSGVDKTPPANVGPATWLASTPYALSVDGAVRVSDAPASCTGLAGQLRYTAGALQVCDGAAYQPVVSTSGVVDFQYAQTSAPVFLPLTYATSNVAPTSANTTRVLGVTITPKAVGDLLVFDGVLVWSESPNTSNAFTMGIFHNGVALALTGDSPMNNGGGCTYQAGYSYVCTTPIRFVTTAPSMNAETYELRAGGDGALQVNLTTMGNTLGGKLMSHFSVMEIAP